MPIINIKNLQVFGKHLY